MVVSSVGGAGDHRSGARETITPASDIAFPIR
jgi:hypothetical protein